MVLELNDNSFNEAIEEKNKITLVDFWAPWCGPCRQLGPTLEEVSSEYASKVTVGKVNVDDFPDIAGKFNIRGIPTMILFKDGKALDTKVGALSKAAILSWIDAHQSA